LKLTGTPASARKIWQLAYADGAAMSRLSFDERDLMLPSIYQVDHAAAASIGVTALAASEVLAKRTGRGANVRVDSSHAAIAYRSERYQRLDGALVEHPVPAQSYFKDRDGRWIQLHMVYPHHRDGICALLGVEADNRAVAAAVAKLDALALETKLAQAGLPGYMQRSHVEWQETEQYRALAALPLLTLEKIGDAPKLELGVELTRALDGLRVLDLTRVIAGPVCGRTLASHGADVMRIHPPHLNEVPGLLMDGGRGKRCTNLNLRDDGDRAAFDSLLMDAHVLVQGFRPGGLESLGYGPAAVAAGHPGIVYVSLSAWSHVGPWAARHGFDSLVQTATGFSDAGAAAAGIEHPKPMPCQALDHSTGYLAAFAAMAALKRRVDEGGSWLARVSLAQTAHWLNGLGRVAAMNVSEPDEATVAARMQRLASEFGELSCTRPVAQFDLAQPFWTAGPVPLGFNAPTW
jgi:crotonobetainyl-CoA:carnitine CoA-transferase CaiB-like acyl-CoA transferase